VAATALAAFFFAASRWGFKPLRAQAGRARRRSADPLITEGAVSTDGALGNTCWT